MPLYSKVEADQEAGKFATKSPHRKFLLVLQEWHFSKFLHLQTFTDNTEFNKLRSQLVTALEYKPLKIL